MDKINLDATKYENAHESLRYSVCNQMPLDAHLWRLWHPLMGCYFSQWWQISSYLVQWSAQTLRKVAGMLTISLPLKCMLLLLSRALLWQTHCNALFRFLLTISQYCFRKWLGDIRQQVITSTNVVKYLWHHIVYGITGLQWVNLIMLKYLQRSCDPYWKMISGQCYVIWNQWRPKKKHDLTL